MEKLNVLFLTSWYPNKTNPTFGNFIQKHAEAINNLVNLHVLHICSDDKLNQKYLINTEVINHVKTTIVYYKKTNIFPVLNSILSYFKYKNSLKKGLTEISSHNKNIKFDIVHCNVAFPAGISALHLLKKDKIPYVLTEHWTVFLNKKVYKNTLSFFKRKSIKKVLENASYILPVSESLLIALEKITNKPKYKVVYNVVDTELFKLNNEVDKTSNIKTILHISHLDNNHKNTEGMLKVIKKISTYRNDFVFHIITDENYENAEKLISELKIEDKFIKLESTKTTEEIAEAYKNASFFLLYSNFETFSVVLAEAWCSGLPSIYSKCGGLTDINNSDLGFQIQPKNDKELENILVKMLDEYQNFDKNKIQKFGVENFNKNLIADEIIEIYRQII